MNRLRLELLGPREDGPPSLTWAFDRCRELVRAGWRYLSAPTLYDEPELGRVRWEVLMTREPGEGFLPEGRP